MPQQLNHNCAFPNCRVSVPAGTSHCELHNIPKVYAPRAYDKNDPHNSWKWRKPGGISDLVISNNPICQFLDVEKWEQCREVSAVVHHLRDWKDAPQLFFEWANLVAICANHHSGGQRGDTQNYAYVDTCGPYESVYPHGFGLPHYHKDYVEKKRMTAAQEILFMATGRIEI